MSNKKIILIILTVLFIVIISFFVGNNLMKNYNKSTIEKEVIANIEEKNDETGFTLTKENEISELLPKNITEITLTNYWSTLEEKPTSKIQDLDKIKEFTDLLYTTSWTEVNIDDYPYTIIDDYIYTNLEYEISFIGDTNCTFQMLQRGNRLDSNNVYIDYGIVSINYKDISKTYEINEKTYCNLISYTSEKYYLHESNLSLPNQEKCYLAQKQAFTSLSNTDKKYIQKKINEIHGGMEYKLLNSVLVLKEPSSKYWEIYTTEGIYETYEDRIHKDKNIIQRDNGFTYYLEELPNIISIIKDKQTKNDLINCYNILQEGIDTHNVAKLFEAHKILHDYDYFVFNTPLQLKTAPADWTGVDIYFGKASILN